MKKITIPKNEKKELKILVNQNNDFLIILGENAELNLVAIFTSKNNFDNKTNFNIYLKENAKLNFINMQKFPENIINDNETTAKLEKNSSLNLFDLNFGSKLTNSSINVNLDGENSRFEHFGLFLGDKEQKFDFDVNVFHNSSYTYSNMLTKGTLNDKSKVNYKGLIRIDKNAHNSNGYQRNDSILLSEDTESYSIPKLEINNNEVRCTHGYSCSQLDGDRLFYIMSRGLNEREAKITLIKGFLQDVTNRLNNKLNLEKLDELISEKIK